MNRILLILALAVVAAAFSGCSADDFKTVSTALGNATTTGLEAKDRYEHPEAYRRPALQGYNQFGQPIYQ